jgi:regulator of ribonuclease activity A
MHFKTADLCDVYSDHLEIAEPIFHDYGGRTGFAGQLRTVKAREDNSRVREALEEAGDGRVLVVDGDGSRRCAMLGDRLAELAHRNGWSGVILFGCIRDAAEIGHIDIGVKALATHPRKSDKRGEGKRDVPVEFAGIRFTPGHYLYADRDGIVVATAELSLSDGE